MKKLLLILLMFATVANAQTFPDWTQIKGAPLLDIRRFGARSGGVVDSTAAFVAANAAATALGGVVLVPDGNYLISTDSLVLSADMVGIGTLTGVASTTTIVPASNVTVSGGNYVGVRFENYNGTNITIRDTNISSVSKSGIGLYATADSLIENNIISGVTYDATLVSADGVFMGGCENIRVVGNKISDFRRIGIVADSYPGSTASASDNIYVIDNTISNANNSDDSVTEYNAAIWAENTDNVTIERNNCYDILGNASQTRAIGMKVSSCYKPCIQRIVGNWIDDSIIVGNPGGPAYPTIILEGNVFDASGRVTIPISSSENFAELNITNNTFTNFATGTAALSSTILLGTASIATGSQEVVRISGNHFDVTHTASSAHVLVYEDYAPRKMFISNQPLVYVAKANATVDPGTLLCIENCGIGLETPGGAYTVAGFETVRVSNSTLPTNYIVGGKYTYINDLRTSVDAILVVPANSDMYLSNCTFTGGVVHYGGVTSSLAINDSLFTGNTSSTAGTACFTTNGQSAGSSNDMLKVQDCTFIAPPSAATPTYAIGLNGSAPAFIYFDGNYYDVGDPAAFTDISTATSTNNVAFSQFNP